MAEFDEWVGFIFRWSVTIAGLLAMPCWISNFVWQRYPASWKHAILVLVRRDAVRAEQERIKREKESDHA